MYSLSSANLIDSGNDPYFREENIQILLAEVGHADGFRFTCGIV